MSFPLYHIQLPEEWLQEQTEYSATPPDPQIQRVVPAVDFPISAPTAETSGPDSAKEPGNILRPGFESDIPDTGPTWNPHHQESILSRLPTLHDQQSLQLIPLQPHLILHSLRYLLFLQSLLPIPKPEFRSGSPNRYGKYLRPMPICAPLISRHLHLLEIRPIRTIRPSIHPMLPAFRPPPSPATKSKNSSTANFLP